MNAMKEWKQRLRAGDVIVVLDDTQRPDRIGDTREVARVTPASIDCIVNGRLFPGYMGFTDEWSEGVEVDWDRLTHPYGIGGMGGTRTLIRCVDGVDVERLVTHA